jgi:RimJ/RimL family protein N-acetyltransferase
MEGFELVKLRPEDVRDEWQAWYDSEHTAHYTRSGRKLTVRELRESIERGEREGNLVTLGIRDTQTDEFVGTVKIGPIDAHHGLADLALLIGDVTYLGKGLAAGFIEEASRWAFNNLRVRKLHSGILQGDVASIKAYTRAGWVVEGLLRQQYVNNGILQDWLVISMFNPEFLANGTKVEHAVGLDFIFGKP